MNSQIIDVLAINETKLDSTIRDTDVYLTGFEIIRLGAGNKWQKWCWWANTIFILGFMLYKWSIHLSHRPFIYVRVSKYSTGVSICEWMNLLHEFNSVFIESGMGGLTFLDQAIPVWVRISAFRLENHLSDTNSGIGIFNPRKYTQTPPRSVWYVAVFRNDFTFSGKPLIFLTRRGMFYRCWRCWRPVTSPTMVTISATILDFTKN